MANRIVVFIMVKTNKKKVIIVDGEWCLLKHLSQFTNTPNYFMAWDNRWLMDENPWSMMVHQFPMVDSGSFINPLGNDDFLLLG